MASVTDWLTKQTTFGYDKNGALTTITYPNTEVTTNTYDKPGRITGQTFVAGATTLGTLTYTPDLAGQLKQQNTTGLGPNQAYTYNSLGQVKTAGGTPFNYDPGDDLTTSGAVTQNYDAANQLTTTVNAGNTVTYGYDTRGNRTTRGSTSYTYDQADRLTKVQTGAVVNGTYTYDGNGLRQAKTVGTTTTRFAYDNVEALPLILNDGTNNYIYGPTGTPIEQLTSAGVATYLHADQLGSPRLLTSPTGTSVGTASYGAYGAPTTTGATTLFGFAGQYTDAETTLIWMRARYYDPDTGQFLTRDPIEALTRAPYSYGAGDPISNTDPLGLWDWNPISDLAQAASAAGQFAGDHKVAIGIVLGVAAAATGVGAIIAGATFAGLVLGAGSVALGAGSGALDYGPCVHNDDAAACAGLALAATGAFAGSAGAVGAGLVGLGIIGEYSLAASILGGVGAFGWNVGMAGTTVDVALALGNGEELC